MTFSLDMGTLPGYGFKYRGTGLCFMKLEPAPRCHCLKPCQPWSNPASEYLRKEILVRILYQMFTMWTAFVTLLGHGHGSHTEWAGAGRQYGVQESLGKLETMRKALGTWFRLGLKMLCLMISLCSFRIQTSREAIPPLRPAALLVQLRTFENSPARCNYTPMIQCIQAQPVLHFQRRP